jgi:hypothetical protein
MFAIWKTHRARRAAVAAIAPHVASSRRNGIVIDAAWLDPYFIGFLAMLITLCAGRAESTLGTEDLAAVQAGAWEEITGLRGHPVGQEMSFLSAARNSMFELGCDNARAFFQAMQATDQACGIADEQEPDGGLVPLLWEQLFEAYLVDHPVVTR